MVTKRRTNHDRASDLAALLDRIRDTTTDPTVYRKAGEGGQLALDAAWCYGNGAFFDASTGGGSGKAWAERAKAGRRLAKARTMLQTLDGYEKTAAAPGTPSIANVLFLRRVAKAAAANRPFPALMADSGQARPCEGERWIEMRSPGISPEWVLTAKGADILSRFAVLAEGIDNTAQAS